MGQITGWGKIEPGKNVYSNKNVHRWQHKRSGRTISLYKSNDYWRLSSINGDFLLTKNKSRALMEVRAFMRSHPHG